MDIFAHTLWTNMVFYKKYKQEVRNRFIAVLFGILPDLVSFTPVFIYAFFSKTGFLDLVGKNIWVVRYASNSYQYTHSIIIFSLAVLLVFIFRKFLGKSAFYWPMFGWLLHILIDIPTHRGFYETPFLFPLSGYRFDHGISWGHPTFMLINYSALAVVYILWFLVWRKQK
jgi:membrane-bound metal-dependent hydrolase YbcI (DUF457 family)